MLGNTFNTVRVQTQGVRPHNTLIASYTGESVMFRAMNWAKEIGKRLRSAREAMNHGSGISLQELSKLTDGVLSPSRISNYEQGIRLLKPQEARILGKALNSDPAYLMCLEGGEMLPEEVDLLSNWRALPEKDRRDYSRRISALALVYKEPVADERVKGFRAPEAKPKKRRTVSE